MLQHYILPHLYVLIHSHLEPHTPQQMDNSPMTPSYVISHLNVVVEERACTNTQLAFCNQGFATLACRLLTN